MRAPSKRAVDELIALIVDELTNGTPDADDKLSTEISVRTTVNLLRAADGDVQIRGEKTKIPFRGRRQENKEDFEALQKQIGDLQKALKKVSSPALVMLCSEEEHIGPEPPPLEAQHRTLERLEKFVRSLEYLKRRCKSLIRQRVGEHGNADHRQRRVAEETWRLLRHHRHEPAGGTSGTLFGHTTSLLWEIMTGERDKDLQWACKTALKAAERGELRQDGPVIARGHISS